MEFVFCWKFIVWIIKVIGGGNKEWWEIYFDLGRVGVWLVVIFEDRYFWEFVLWVGGVEGECVGCVFVDGI